MKEFDKLVEIMHRLRHECPWDKEQNLESLRRYLIEEAYECLDAMNQIEETGPAPLIDELGDVLLQILFQTEILSEDLEPHALQMVLRGLQEKLIRRHPHVFGNRSVKNAQEVVQNWEEVKKSEKKNQVMDPLAGIPAAMTALQRAFALGKKSKKNKFDWNKAPEIWHQVCSEMQELEQARTFGDVEEEFGDLLFSLVQWARHKDIDPEVALSAANLKFIRRFHGMQGLAKQKSQSFSDLSTKEKEKLWQQIKQNEKKRS